MDYFVEERESFKRIIFFVPDDSVEKVINSKVMEVIAPELGKDSADYVYLCIKEIVNYLTAINVVSIAGVGKINDRTSLLFNDSYLGYFRERAKAKRSFVEVDIISRDGGVIVEIYNSFKLPEDHETKIRDLLRKLSSGEKFEIPLTNYSGYDFLLSIMTVWYILKEIGIENKFFRIGNVGNRTVVRIEIPFSENYKSVRDA